MRPKYETKRILGRPDRLANMAETAAFLDISERTVLRMVQTRRIPALRVLRSWRFDLDEVKAALQVVTTEEVKG